MRDPNYPNSYRTGPFFKWLLETYQWPVWWWCSPKLCHNGFISNFYDVLKIPDFRGFVVHGKKRGFTPKKGGTRVVHGWYTAPRFHDRSPPNQLQFLRCFPQMSFTVPFLPPPHRRGCWAHTTTIQTCHCQFGRIYLLIIYVFWTNIPYVV